MSNYQELCKEKLTDNNLTNNFGEELIKSLNDVIDHLDGKKKLKTFKVGNCKCDYQSLCKDKLMDCCTFYFTHLSIT